MQLPSNVSPAYLVIEAGLADSTGHPAVAAAYYYIPYTRSRFIHLLIASRVCKALTHVFP